MTIRATIDKAGRFPVKQVAVPFEHNLKVDWSAPPAGVLHTTEGGWTGSLSVFKVHYAPHFMLGMDEQTKRVEIVQYVPVGLYGLALMSHPKGDGNKIARVQIEMIGYAQEKLWQPDPETMDALASLMLVCRDEWGIPLSHPWADGDFGRASDNPHRHSGKYGTIAGWFGHGDIPSPENHWDPGALAWSKVFDRAKALAAPPKPKSRGQH